MIYLDYNATTPLSAAAWRAMQPFFERHFGNPSSVHRAGRETRVALDEARDRLAAERDAGASYFILDLGRYADAQEFGRSVDTFMGKVAR